MGRHLAKVKFQDGDVLFTEYVSSSDGFSNVLFTSQDDVWKEDASFDHYSKDCECEWEDVEIYTSYADLYVHGTACKKHKRVYPKYTHEAEHIWDEPDRLDYEGEGGEDW